MANVGGDGGCCFWGCFVITRFIEERCSVNIFLLHMGREAVVSAFGRVKPFPSPFPTPSSFDDAASGEAHKFSGVQTTPISALIVRKLIIFNFLLNLQLTMLTSLSSLNYF